MLPNNDSCLVQYSEDIYIMPFQSYNKTKWTAIITGITSAVVVVIDAIFNVIGLFT